MFSLSHPFVPFASKSGAHVKANSRPALSLSLSVFLSLCVRCSVSMKEMQRKQTYHIKHRVKTRKMRIISNTTFTFNQPSSGNCQRLVYAYTHTNGISTQKWSYAQTSFCTEVAKVSDDESFGAVYIRSSEIAPICDFWFDLIGSPAAFVLFSINIFDSATQLRSGELILADERG